MLLGGGMIAVFGSELVHLEGAGPLAVVAAAFVSIWIWSTQGWDIEDVSGRYLIQHNIVRLMTVVNKK